MAEMTEEEKQKMLEERMPTSVEEDKRDPKGGYKGDLQTGADVAVGGNKRRLLRDI